MKDFLVKMVRREEIRIRADNAKDAAAMATQFPMSCWEDEFEITVKAANEADRDGEALKSPTKASKKRKRDGGNGSAFVRSIQKTTIFPSNGHHGA